MSKKNLKSAILLLAVLCMVFVFAACEDNELKDETFLFKNGVITGLTEEGLKKTELVVPAVFGEGAEAETITEIGIFAFKDTTALKKITISEGIKVIGNGAFWDSSVETVILPESLESIGSTAFSKCLSLKDINIHSAVKSIGNYAFQSCTSLETVVIESGFTTVPVGIFSACSNLKSVTLPAGVTAVGNGAFTDCDKLEDISFLPASVETIGADAFVGCDGIKTIEFASRFRKTLTVEQYRNPEMRELFERYLSVGPFEYTRDEFEKAGVRNPEKRAAELYSAMFFGYSLVDSGVVFSFGDFADGFFAGEDFK